MSKKVYTIGELREALEEYDDDTDVRVSDDGMHFAPTPELRDGTVVL